MSAKLLYILLLLVIPAGCVAVPTITPPQGRAAGPLASPPAANIVLIMLENKNVDSALDEKLRFLSRLRHEGAYLSNYYAVAHPSQPNYVALVSGSIEGVAGDNAVTLHRTHLGDELASWMVYAEGYPAGSCFTGTRANRYVRKHVPFLSFADVQNDEKFCRTHITDFDAFLTTARAHQLPRFSMVIPNLDDDAHDGSLQTADQWLDNNFRPLLADAAFRRDTVLVVTFDENDASWPYLQRNNNKVFTVLWGNHVIPGEYATVYDHYDLLRTMEAMFNIAPMAKSDGKARVMGGMWR